MRLNMEQATLTLQANSYLKLRGARGVRLTCREGLLWVTQEGVSRDDFIEPGAGLPLTADGDVLIEALSDSVLTLVHEQTAARRRRYWLVSAAA